MPKKHVKKQVKEKSKEENEWPVVVYVWAFGLGLLGYLIVEAGWRDSLSHPMHWLGGLVGGLIGILVGWQWYFWRGDVF